MFAHHVYAFVENDVIQQLQICENEAEADRIVKICCPNGHQVNVDLYPVRVGDIHIGGSFFRKNGDETMEVEILPIVELESQINAYKEFIHEKDEEIAYLKKLLHDRDIELESELE